MNYDYCIVGAGPSGLSLAYKLLEAGRSVVMIERNSRSGGLSKSYNYDGHIFDTGPKRFHTDDPIVQDFISSISEMDTIGRSTMVHFLAKYFNWPLQPSELIKMPIGVSVKSFFDLLSRPDVSDRQAFQDVIRNKYGDTLYGLFFKPYTEKFLRWPAEDIHSDWASTGINRTVIDKRVKANSIVDLMSSMLLPQKLDTTFLYPAKGGFGAFFDTLYARCLESENFVIHFNDTLAELEKSTSDFSARTSSGQTIKFENLIWAGNVKDLGSLISPESYRLQYLNTIFYNFICRDHAVANNRAQWIYVSDGKSLVSRITCMREFSPSVSPNGYYNFICELTDSQTNPEYFQNPEAHKDGIMSELKRMNFLKSSGAVEAIHINPVVDTYPIYHKSYHRDFGKISKHVRNFSRRIHLLGRSGAFWYNNSDHSIRMAIDMSRTLLRDPEKIFDYRAYFGGVSHKENEASDS